MILQTYTIARNTFTESVRQPVMFLLVLGSGLLQLFNTWNTGFSMADTTESSQVKGDDKLLFDIGLATIFGIGTLLAGFLATAAISREIENKTVLTVVSKPISRPVVVLGKFFGVATAIFLATIVMLVFLLMAIRHGVMSTTADELDGPVLVLSLGGVALTLLLAGWFNFFYGWSFPQMVITVLTPVMVVAYILVLLLDKHWKYQPLLSDVKDQVMLACACLVFAILVLTAVATAASTRLGQVMTIVVCLGVFVAALLSNHLLGRHVFTNEPVGVILTATPEDGAKTGYDGRGDYFNIRLDQPPAKLLEPGTPFYYGPTPNGYPMMTIGTLHKWEGAIDDTEGMLKPPTEPSSIIMGVDGLDVRIRNIGSVPLRVARPPDEGDYVFTEPTRINYVAGTLWGIVPNLQFFWLLDAVSQNRPVPGIYVALTFFYSLAQIGMFLSLAVILFQKRDVG